MHLYSVYIRNNSGESTPVIIKQGFSFWALLFGIFWALHHRMWLVALLTIMLNLGSTYLYNKLPNLPVQQFGYIIQSFIFGFFASEIRELYAEKSTYSLSDIIFAASEEDAEIKYISRRET